MLTVRELSKRYGERAALDGLSFELPAGQFAALLGPNGAGKSTLFQVLTGLFAADAGEARVGGHSLREAAPQALAQIGVVFRQIALDLDLSVQRNLRFQADLHGLPRKWLLLCKLFATAVLSLLQALAFVLVARLMGTELPLWGAQTPAALLAATASALMLGALGLLLSVHIKQLENFAGTMNFVIFPMYFMSTALYPLWKLEESGARWVFEVARFNPFTHAVEWMRFALYGKDAGWSPAIVLGVGVVCFALAAWGCDPQRGFGQLAKRGGA